MRDATSSHASGTHDHACASAYECSYVDALLHCLWECNAAHDTIQTGLESRLQIGRLDGYRKVLRLLVEGEDGLSREALSTLQVAVLALLIPLLLVLLPCVYYFQFFSVPCPSLW